MKYLFESAEVCQNALNIINNNMGYDGISASHDIVHIPNNPEHLDYGKAYIGEVEGDEYHHTLWMTGVDGVIQYNIVEYDSSWFIPIKI